MRDVYEVLRAKEIRIQQLTRELEALRLVAPLLTDDADAAPVLEDAAGFRGEPEIHEIASVTDGAKQGAAKRISDRLKRLATPLLNAVDPAS